MDEEYIARGVKRAIWAKLKILHAELWEQGEEVSLQDLHSQVIEMGLPHIRVAYTLRREARQLQDGETVS